MRKVFVILLGWFLLTMPAAQNAFAADTIKIAALFAKTGPAAPSTIHHFQAARYAVEELNAAGGLLGKQIELIELDNNSSPIKSKLAAMEAVRDKVVAVIGSSWSDHSIAAAKVLQKHGIPMITPDSTNPQVTKIGDYIFRVGLVDSMQGQILADFAALTLKAENAVIIQCISSAYSLGLSRTFQDEFKLQGKKILGILDYKLGRTDFAPIIKKAMALDPELLFIPGYDESGLIVKQAQEMGVDAVMLGGDGWTYREFYANGGMELKKGYYTCHWAQELDYPESLAFVENYRKVYNLNESAALTYDAVMILAQAIRDAGSTDRAKIRDALSSIKNFQGVTGPISLNESGDPKRSAVIMEITDGKGKVFQTMDSGSKIEPTEGS